MNDSERKKQSFPSMPRQEKHDKPIIFGRQPIREWLESDLPVKQLLLSREAGGAAVQEILKLAEKKNIPIKRVHNLTLDHAAQTEKHQNMVAEVELPAFVDVETLFQRAQQRGEPPLLAIADGIQDPHNLGAILRTADAAGVHGIIIPKDQAVGMTPAVVKASAGAAAFVPLVQETNLVRTMKELKERGVWITGADEDGDRLYTKSDFKGSVALLIGSEGRGIRRLVRETCDFMVRIPMHGRVRSLNASVAAALLFYEARRQRNG